MRPVGDAFLEETEAEAFEWLGELKKARTYQGGDKRYIEKAKIGLGLISALARMRASESNRMAIELAAARVLPPPATKQVVAGHGK